MVAIKMTLAEQIRCAVTFARIPVFGRTVHALQGHLLPAETVKTAWVAPALEELKSRGEIPAAGVVEASSGSTAKACAWTCQQLDEPCTIYIPANCGVVIEQVRAYGATVCPTPVADGMPGAIAAMREAARASGALPLNQFVNEQNPAQFARLLAPIFGELLDPSRAVCVAACAGTGGTLVGMIRALLERRFRVDPVRVYPVSGDGDRTRVVYGVMESLPRFVVGERFGIDRWTEMWVSDEQVQAAVAQLRAAGHAVGASSGANVEAVGRLILCHQQDGNLGVQYVTVFHDSASRYAS